MLLILLKFALAAAVIVVAGSFLTRYADALAVHTRLGQALAGAVLLATATSLPELTVDCSLARQGTVDIAVGDLLGSSLFNLLILAGIDLVQRSPRRMLSRMAAAHALSATMSVMLTAICLIALLTHTDRTFLGVGPGPIALALVYVLGLRLVHFDQQFAAAAAAEAEPNDHPDLPSLGQSILGFGVAAVVILLTGPRMATYADQVATATGLGGTFVGTTLVACSTSLPELVTTWAAVRMRAFDLAIGNIFGSNSFNMIIFLPVDACYSGSLFAAASPTHALSAGCVIIVTSVYTLGMLYRAERRYWLLEPDALLVILLIFSALGLIRAMGG
ncbi:MAG: hypothetical protein K1X74_05230 [Pirellulales bacterium]|nr:hypothetical protein [Pirellulales bacterium]